jgi:hypothetical protein
MKHLVEETVVGDNDGILVGDVWREVFPFLYQECLWFWLNLSLVSKNWFRMVGLNKVLVMKKQVFSPEKTGLFTVITERFGGVVSMIADASILYHINHQNFPHLRELNLIGKIYGVGEGPGGIRIISISCLHELKSLTLGADVTVKDIEKLTNLEYLSVMYINSSTSRCVGINQIKHIKHLCLGGIGALERPDLASMIPHDIQYLESNDRELFRNIGYTGRGKLTTNFPTIVHRYLYEGQWNGGKRHGKGSIATRGDVIRGMWDYDVITRGKIFYKNGDYYKGGLFGGYAPYQWGGVRIDAHDPIKRHGFGRFYKEGSLVYEGEWTLDVINV